jgi:hypothetical protein
MKLLTRTSVLAAAAIVAIGGSAAADSRHRPLSVKAWLTGFEEVPSTISSPGRGFFRAIVDEDAGTIRYWLTYDGIPNVPAPPPANQAVTGVTQSHLHFGSHHTAGGISVFLCSNLGNGPAGTQPCPSSGQISGTIAAANVIGPGAQGIGAGEFAELVAAIRNKAVYVNIHSAVYGPGEIRGQLVP